MLTYTLMRLDHEITRVASAQVPEMNAAAWQELHEFLAGMHYSAVISWGRNMPTELHWYRSSDPDPRTVAPATLCLLNRNALLQYIDLLLTCSPFVAQRPVPVESN
jgi:hypothetical protein